RRGLARRRGAAALRRCGDSDISFWVVFGLTNWWVRHKGMLGLLAPRRGGSCFGRTSSGERSRQTAGGFGGISTDFGGYWDGQIAFVGTDRHWCIGGLH